ncbi:MAG: EAL domain-containing protein [Burkholderiales bacterium]|nr:EAL domain-containing protein [Burkholderiales bacterium]
MSLKTRVLLVVLILLIAGIWGLAIRVSSVLQADIEKMVADQLSATVGYIAIDMDANLKLRVTILDEIAALITPAMLKDPERIQFLLEQRHPSPSIFPHGLVVFNKEGAILGNYLHGTKRSIGDIESGKNIRAVVSGGKPYSIAPYMNPQTKKPAISITVPLRDAADIPVGALMTSVSPLDIDLFNFRDSPLLGKVVRIVVISPKARQVISASDADRVFKPMPPKGENPLLDRRLEQGFEGMGITKTSYGADTLSVNRNLRMTDWTVIAGVSTEHAFGPIKTLQRQIYLTAILISIAVALMLRMTLIRQLAPLKEAADAMRRMAEEKPHSLQPLPVRRDDEVGLLVSNFNRLMLERNRLYTELQESARTLQKAQSVASIGSWKLDIAHSRLTWSEEAYKILGVPMDTPLTAKFFLRRVLPEDRKAVIRAWKNALEGESVDIEHRVNTSEDVKWARQKLEIMFDDTGKPMTAIGTVQEITQSKVSEARIEFLAFHDTLTKLPNRLLARDRMELATAYADRLSAKAAVLFIDLDKFKSINDSLGHLAGDALLKGVASRLRECVRETETICRQGGDEFLIILSAMHDTDAISKIADKILEKMASPFNIEGHQIFTSLSIGIAVYPDDGRDFETLVKAADTAMYHSKEAGRNTYRFYTEQMNVDTTSHLKTRNDLRHALVHGEFVLHYQPQVDINNAETIGVEALIRWNHPEHGLVSAKDIIPVAEDSGLIIPIGQWVLKEACKQAVAWHGAGLADMVVTVNLSSVQFKRGDLEKTVMFALSESGLDPKYLELELTESILIQDSEHALSLLQRLKALGVKLSIDDFGTGYSSLAYLKRFDVDKLKIDQSFIRDLARNTEDEAIVRAIIQMAHSLNLKTIAEGVEQEQSLKILRDLHCDEVQGAYFGMPMPTEKIVNYFQHA